MKTKSISHNVPASKTLYAALLFIGTIGAIFLSPKWAVPVFAWIVPGLLLFYFRHATLRFKMLLFILMLIIAQMFSSYNVAPFPLPVLAILSIIDGLKLLAVYLVDRWVSKRSSRFISTLVFPAAYVTKEFIDLSFGGGAWYSIANTQYPFHWLAQLSSVTGLAGISFLIYWFASVAVWSIEKYFSKERFAKAVWIYAGVFISVMIFGAVRFSSDKLEKNPSVKIAGVTASNLGVMENIYKDVSGKTIVIDPKSSPSSQVLQQVNAALIPFFEHPDTAKFINGYKAIYRLHDSLFSLSQKAADKGAKIIVWSEGNGITLKPMRNSLLKRGENFAAKNNVYLLMTLAVFEPGKITTEKMFLENAAVMVGPDGKILNVFHKNHPVPFAERSVPGDGKIPAIKTPYGIVSTSICYDADIPGDMRQLSQNRADLLLLPSGDWHDIAPYHSYMATFRGIENGTTILRQASGGLSLVTDYRGKTLTSFDYYKPGEKIWTADIVTGHIPTIYAKIGDVFAYACIAFTAGVIVFLIVNALRKRKSPRLDSRVRL